MAGRKSDFTLTKLDDLFTTQALREEEKTFQNPGYSSGAD